jgi:hypothetical protein
MEGKENKTLVYIQKGKDRYGISRNIPDIKRD